jgi:hypothetical protein
MLTKERIAELAKQPPRKPVQPSEIPAIRRACLEKALAAVANHDGRMTGVYRDIERLIKADEDEAFRQRLAETKREDKPYQGGDFNEPRYGRFGAVRSD